MAQTSCVQSVKTANNPLLKEWSGPYGGVPPLDQVRPEHFAPALEKSISEQRQAYQRIAEQTEAPTLANTLIALEKISTDSQQVLSLYYTWGSSMNSADFQKVQSEWAPKLAAFQDEIFQNEALFKRLQALGETADKKSWTAEQVRLFDETLKGFTRNGAQLDAQKKSRVAAINQELAKLSTEFNQKILKEEAKYLLIKDRTELDGVSESLIVSFSEAAKEKGFNDQYLINNTRSSIEPVLTLADDRSLREKAFSMWTSRGDNADENNTHGVIQKIVQLRAEKAQIFGFSSFADWRLDETMAKNPGATMDLMLKVWKPAIKQAKRDIDQMKKLASKAGIKDFKAWDHRYFAEKLRQEKFDLDFNLVKPYLQMEQIKQAMFWTANEIFGLEFEKVTDVPTFIADQEVYRVTDRERGFIGLFYFDPYTREGKNSGAWMSAFRAQHRLGGENTPTLVTNNCNFIKSKPGEPVLLSWDDAVTMFHEFGHALHGLLSNVNYPSLSGTSVPLDYVEFPSQVMENFLPTPKVLKFLVNSEGKTLPPELIKKMEKAKNFNQGFAMVEFLASALVDMKLHLEARPDRLIDVRNFEKTTLASLDMPVEIVMRHRLPQFNHLFTGGWYAAGYYAYLWAQVLEKDAFQAFLETKNPYHPKVAKKLKDHIFSPGNSLDPMEAYKQFRGRPAKPEALLKAKGFM